jgi:hypothetical protein
MEEVSLGPCPDVFQLLKTKPHQGDIYIVGAGPNGKHGIGRIPAGAITIALNSAIRYEFRFTYWLAFDCAIRRYDWWPILSVPVGTVPVFGCTLAAEHWGTPEHLSGRIVPRYTFRFRPSMSPQWAIERRQKQRTTPLISGILRGGASIAGAAFHFAAWAGAKRIIICGVDMMGNKHFDGFVNRGMRDAEWPICPKITWLAESLKMFHRINTISLTQTAVKVPVI